MAQLKGGKAGRKAPARKAAAKKATPLRKKKPKAVAFHELIKKAKHPKTIARAIQPGPAHLFMRTLAGEKPADIAGATDSDCTVQARIIASSIVAHIFADAWKLGANADISGFFSSANSLQSIEALLNGSGGYADWVKTQYAQSGCTMAVIGDDVIKDVKTIKDFVKALVGKITCTNCQ